MVTSDRLVSHDDLSDQMNVLMVLLAILDYVVQDDRMYTYGLPVALMVAAMPVHPSDRESFVVLFCSRGCLCKPDCQSQSCTLQPEGIHHRHNRRCTCQPKAYQKKKKRRALHTSRLLAQINCAAQDTMQWAPCMSS